MKSRKDYHTACKLEKTATHQENNARGDTGVSADQVRFKFKKNYYQRILMKDKMHSRRVSMNEKYDLQHRICYIRSHVGIVCYKAGGQYEVFVIQFEVSLKVYVLKLIIVDTKEKTTTTEYRFLQTRRSCRRWKPFSETAVVRFILYNMKSLPASKDCQLHENVFY